MKPLHDILLVEDDPDIQVIARLALETVGGLHVVVADSGEAALSTLEGFTPDLILLDVMMPGLDGPATLRRLRQRPATAATPAIFMTAKAQANAIQGLLDQGAIAVITKPFDPMTLADEIKQHWERHHGR